MMKEAQKYLLDIGFDEAHLPELFNDDDKSTYTIPELMEGFAKSQPKWVSVEDRLPNENTLVQTYGNPNDGGLHICNCWYSGNDIWRFQHGNNRENKHLITHWMELPPPPQTKQV